MSIQFLEVSFGYKSIFVTILAIKAYLQFVAGATAALTWGTRSLAIIRIWRYGRDFVGLSSMHE